ncbi:MAG: hypothetical protein IPL96_15770 [Holophagaceae bacterium]|nr:hypothetical protein [Holophagaceae bacterium]
MTKQAIGTMASTLRAAAYCAPILVPFVVLNLSLHEQSFYILGTAVPLAALLIPGLAKMHGLSKWRTAAAVILALGVMAPLSWYAHNDLLTHLKETVLEFKGWAT